MIEIKKQDLTVYSKSEPIAAQTALSVKLAAGQVAKVLYLGAEPIILNYECGKGEILISGRCNYKLLTLSEEGEVSGLNYNADFADRIVAPSITPDTQVCLIPDLLDNTYTVGESSINISTLVNTTATAVSQAEISAVSGVDGAQSLTKQVEISDQISYYKVNSSLVSELEVGYSVARILFSDSFLDLSDTQISDGVLTVSGRCGVNLVYVADNGEIISQTPKFDFTEEIAVKSIPENATLLCAKTLGAKIHINIAEEEQNTLLSAEIPVALDFCYNSTRLVDLVADVYSTSNSLSVSSAQVSTTLPLSASGFQVELAEQIPLDCDSLIGVIGEKIEIVKLTPRDDGLDLEGLLTLTALYKKDGEITSAYYELPFSRVLELSLPAKLQVIACAQVVSTVVKCDRQTLTLTLTVKVKAVFESNEKVKFISEISEGEAFLHNCAFEICIAKKGDDLWTTAKNLNMTEKDILQTNPDLTFPLEKDSQIVVYYKA